MAPHYTQIDHYSNNDGQGIKEKIDELRPDFKHALIFINEPANDLCFTKGDIGIIVLAHALHLSGGAIGFILGILFLEKLRTIDLR